jgi:hypothetical protein
MLTIKPTITLGKVLRVLDKPIMWIFYLILAVYLMFAGLCILRGIVLYNRILDVAEAADKVEPAKLNLELQQSGFKIQWGESPSVVDFFFAGIGR